MIGKDGKIVEVGYENRELVRELMENIGSKYTDEDIDYIMTDVFDFYTNDDYCRCEDCPWSHGKGHCEEQNDGTIELGKHKYCDMRGRYN